MKITKILAGALLLTGSMFASAIQQWESVSYDGPNYGVGGVKATVGTASQSSEEFRVLTKEGSYKSTATKEDNGYEWVLSWNVDPTLSWSLTTVINGFQTYDFFIPTVGGPYDLIFNSAGYTLTGARNGKGATISNVKVEALVPYPGTSVPQGDVLVPGIGPITGTKTTSEDNTGNGGVGPFVAFAPTSPAQMGVRVSFTANLNGSDQLSLNGTLTIEKSTPPVPEPATFGLIGAALVALGAFARRRA